MEHQDRLSHFMWLYNEATPDAWLEASYMYKELLKTYKLRVTFIEDKYHFLLDMNNSCFECQKRLMMIRTTYEMVRHSYQKIKSTYDTIEKDYSKMKESYNKKKRKL